MCVLNQALTNLSSSAGQDSHISEFLQNYKEKFFCAYLSE